MMKWTVYFWIILFILACSSENDNAKATPDVGSDGFINLASEWQASSASEESIGDLSNAVSLADAHPRLTSLLVARNGKLVAEHYFDGSNSNTLQDVRSITKSIVATLVGIALEEGAIKSLDDSIGFYLSDMGIALTSAQEEITIRNLLTMSSGFQWPEIGGSAYSDWILSGDPIGYLLNQPMASTPGTEFNYNSAATNLLARVLESAVSQNIESYAQSRLFDPIGIDQVTWEYFADGTANGGAGIDLRPRDLARLGQLYLQEGQSGANTVVEGLWIGESTTPRYSWRSNFGALKNFTYGYQWWVTDGLYEGFLAWGHGGQYIFVSPSKNLVVVTTVNWRNSAAAGGADALEKQALEVIFEEVLPQIN